MATASDAFATDCDEYRQLSEDMLHGRIAIKAVAKDIFETDNDIYARFGMDNFRKGFNAVRKKLNRKTETGGGKLSFFSKIFLYYLI